MNLNEILTTTGLPPRKPANHVKYSSILQFFFTMHDLKTLKAGGYRDAKLAKLKLTAPLDAFPPPRGDL